MKDILIFIRDFLRGWVLSRSDCQWVLVVYGALIFLAGSPIVLSLLGVGGLLPYAPIVLALMAFGGFMAQGYEWRQHYGMSVGCESENSGGMDQ